MKTIRKLAAPVLPFAGEFSPEQLPQAWQNLEEWEIACYPWSAPDGYRPKACARVGVHEGDLHVLMYALEPELFSGLSCWVGVECRGPLTRGRTVTDAFSDAKHPDGPNALLVREVDRPRFVDHLIRRLALYP